MGPWILILNWAGSLSLGLGISSKIFLVVSTYNLLIILSFSVPMTIFKTRIMDIMDLFEELEVTVLSCPEEPEDEDRNEPSNEDIARWQSLFNYSPNDVVSRIEERRKDYSRNRVSNEYWEILQPGMEAQGYNREAYEYTSIRV